jgi:UPF0716 protein FxsA
MLLRLLPWFLVLLLSLPLIEIGSTIWLANEIGWWVLAWYGASALVGIALLRSWRWAAAWALIDSARQGELPFGRLFWVARSFLAGLLFIFPGPVSDLLGLVLVLPWPNRWFGLDGGDASSRRGAAPGADGGVIEGEFVRVEESRGVLPPN